MTHSAILLMVPFMLFGFVQRVCAEPSSSPLASPLASVDPSPTATPRPRTSEWKSTLITVSGVWRPGLVSILTKGLRSTMSDEEVIESIKLEGNRLTMVVRAKNPSHDWSEALRSLTLNGVKTQSMQKGPEGEILWEWATP